MCSLHLFIWPLIFFVPLLTVAAYQQSTTSLLNPAANWAVRQGFSGAVEPLDGSIYITGGWGGGPYFNDVWRSGTTWQQQTSNAGFSARSGLMLVADKHRTLYVSAGLNQQDVWKSIDQGVTWAPVTTTAPWSGRMSHCYMIDSNDVHYIMGGYNDVSSTYYNDVWKSLDQGLTWSLVTASAGWAPRFCTGGIDHNDIIYVVGGASPSVVGFSDVWSSSNGGVSWSLRASSPTWSGRASHTLMIDSNNNLYVFGGTPDRGATQLSDLYFSSNGGAQWVLVNGSTAIGGRYNMAVGGNQGMMRLDDVLLVIGGTNSVH